MLKDSKFPNYNLRIIFTVHKIDFHNWYNQCYSVCISKNHQKSYYKNDFVKFNKYPEQSKLNFKLKYLLFIQFGNY